MAEPDPRWGVLVADCPGYWVAGLGTQYVPMHALVSRAGRSGSFSKLHAIVVPAAFRTTRACRERTRWPVPAAARVALGFCAPWPHELMLLD